MSMTDFWKDFGLGLMNLFDLPGSMVRDAFAWENPLDQIASPFSAKNRATGADVLRNFGVEDPGMLAGMGVEMLLDPLTLAGGLGALKGAKMSAKLGPRYRTTFRKRIENLDDAGSIRITDERRVLPPKDPVERELLREIPPGSRQLGKQGMEAMALETPQGGVVRVGRSVLNKGNIVPLDTTEGAIIARMSIPDIEQMVPIRRNAVIRSDTATPTPHNVDNEIWRRQARPSSAPVDDSLWRSRNLSSAEMSEDLGTGITGRTTATDATGPRTKRRVDPVEHLHATRRAERRSRWPATVPSDEMVLSKMSSADQQLLAPMFGEEASGLTAAARFAKRKGIAERSGVSVPEMDAAMKRFRQTKGLMETPTPGHEMIQVTHSPKLDEVTRLELGQGGSTFNLWDDAEKAAYTRQRMEGGSTADYVAHQITYEEVEAWKDAVSRQGLSPWDVHVKRSDQPIHNLMINPETGMAVTNDPGAIGQIMVDVGDDMPIGKYELALEEAGRGGSGWHKPTVVDITSNRPIGKKITDMIEDMIWDPITTVTGHRARTRAAVAGMKPGMYGKAMPYIAPVIPPSLRMARPLIGTEEEEPDVLGAL